MTPHVDERDPDENACRYRIERCDGKNSIALIAIECVDHAQSNSHSNRCYKSEDSPHEELVDRLGLDQGSNPGAQCKTFEHLMEDDDNE